MMETFRVLIVDDEMDFLETIIQEANQTKIKSAPELLAIFRAVHKKFPKEPFPSNIILLKTYLSMVEAGRIKPNKVLQNLLVTKKMRSLSGISVITVLTKPYSCPGKCIYCPTQKGVPKSYLAKEPAVMRAILNKYDAKNQVLTRLKSLQEQGHPVSKIEVIVIGGTFSCLPKKYQEKFVKEVYDALNGEESKNLDEAKKKNEIATHLLVGLTLETRPDFINQKEIKWMRYLGATRVEIGVQSLDDEILKLNKRGHNAARTAKATKLLKNAGFKICYHVMPNLYGSNLKKDLEDFKELFSDARFRPDYIKIYPCMVIKGTELYNLWKKGDYKSYSDDELFDLIKKMQKDIPYYVRVQRVIRDIPAQYIESGSKVSNLRQLLESDGKNVCRCIRCREIKGEKPKGKITFFCEKYQANDGDEYFLSFESKDRGQLYALLRLRLTPKTDLPVLKNAALVREIHTYGPQLSLGSQNKKASQHQGLGKKLLAEAEKISKKNGFKKIAVISGIGVRDYYRKLGYKLQDEYMVKNL